MSNITNDSHVYSAWILLTSALVMMVTTFAAAWQQDIGFVVLGAVLIVAFVLIAALGFWCEGYKACDRESAAASGETP